MHESSQQRQLITQEICHEFDPRSDIASMEIEDFCSWIRTKTIKVVKRFEQALHVGAESRRPLLRKGIAARYGLSLLAELHNEGFLAEAVENDIHDRGNKELRERIANEIWPWMERNRIRTEFLGPQKKESDQEGMLSAFEKGMKAVCDVPGMDDFRRVRTARYVDINGGNIEEFLPKIRQSYERAWLRPETLEKLSRDSADDIQSFKEETGKGIFVYGFDEKPNEGLSIQEEIIRDLKSEKDPQYFPRFQCKCLLDENGEVIAWLTYWQPPAYTGKNTEHPDMIKEYLQHGVTGGHMQYTVKPPYKDYKSNFNEFLLFDTLRGEVPMAAARLFPHALQDMIAECPRIQSFISYRLYELFQNPSFPKFDARIRLFENTKSDSFFSKRGCTSFAIDYSKRGKKSMRELSDGSTTSLNPAWIALSGDIRQMYRKSLELWNIMQCAHGDPTCDGLDTKYGSRTQYF